MSRIDSVNVAIKTEDRSKRSIRRAVNGLLLLDKPRGMTSNQALQTAKRLLAARKAGHTGSLDPIATGLLPLCFGEATKLSQFLLDADKRYRTVFQLGVSTTTQDAEGAVTQVRPVNVSLHKIECALTEFEGEIEQIPPMYSAIKRNGRALYELARAGIEVERAPRRVIIHSVRVHRFEQDRLELDIACSKGTYIRSLAHDLGELLGCGAHVAELQRLAVGELRIEQAIGLDALMAVSMPEERAKFLQPADTALEMIPGVHLSVAATYYLRQGVTVSTHHMQSPGWVRLYDVDNLFLGMGQVLDDGRVAPRRLVAQT